MSVNGNVTPEPFYQGIYFSYILLLLGITPLLMSNGNSEFAAVLRSSIKSSTIKSQEQNHPFWLWNDYKGNHEMQTREAPVLFLKTAGLFKLDQEKMR